MIIKRNYLILCSILITMFVASPVFSADDDLATLRENQMVRVGAVEAAPWYTKDLVSDQWTGLVPDVINAIFADSGIEVSYVDTQWGTAVAGLQSGRFDLMGAYNATPERLKAIDFTDPMGELKFAVMTLKPDENLTTWEDVDKAGRRLAAVDGAGATTALKPLLSKLEWVLMPSSDDMFMQMESGRSDALVTSDVQISQYIQKRGRGSMVVPTPVRGQSTNIGLRKSDDPALRNWLNERLAALQADGTIDKIWAKYTAVGK